jgi:hypothetical protein
MDTFLSLHKNKRKHVAGKLQFIIMCRQSFEDSASKTNPHIGHIFSFYDTKIHVL